MSKKKEKKDPIQEAPAAEEILEERAEAAEDAGAETEPQADPPGEAPEAAAPEDTEAPVLEQMVPKEQFLRLAAEYDNYRKRTAKEKESAWSEAKAQTVAAFLPVYDNLERALKQPTADEAYKKGVEMTMKGLCDVLTGLGVEMIPALGESFDPNRHNAVMHCDDEEAGESTIVEVFQQGFLCGDRVIRFSMVKVAN